jgi:hypothetical protein
MNDVQGDLAFMRALVADSGRARMAGGAVFLWGGLLYGLQCFAYWAQGVGLLPLSDQAMFWLAISISALFLVILAFIIWRDRKAPKGGASSRALTAAFTSAGLANLALTIVFGTTAVREHNFLIWLLYPIVVCAMQGAAWYVAYMIRKRLWLAAVSAGWFITSVALGFTLGSLNYVLLLGVALLVLMALPGYILLRLAQKPA